jgi:hypothetical protein
MTGVTCQSPPWTDIDRPKLRFVSSAAQLPDRDNDVQLWPEWEHSGDPSVDGFIRAINKSIESQHKYSNRICSKRLQFAEFSQTCEGTNS